MPPHPNESIRDFLQRREPELREQVDKLRAQLIPLEKELAEVRKVMTELGLLNRLGMFQAPPIDYAAALMSAGNPPAPIPNALAFLFYEGKTIKQLILKALTEHFTNGATAAELCEFFLNAYGRNVERNSLSPQLSRLKEEGIVENDASADTAGKFVVAKAFNSLIRRFKVGMEISIPTDEPGARQFAKELEPLDLDHLKKRGFIVSPSGVWKLTNRGKNARSSGE